MWGIDMYICIYLRYKYMYIFKLYIRYLRYVYIKISQWIFGLRMKERGDEGD